MDALYPSVQRRFSANAEALAKLSLSSPVIEPTRIGWWHGMKENNRKGQRQTIHIDRRPFEGYLKQVDAGLAFADLTAGLLASRLGAPAAPCIAIHDPESWWIFSAATFSDTQPPALQHWFHANPVTQGMAGQFAALINDPDRHAINHVYSKSGVVSLFDFEMPPYGEAEIRPDVIKWQLLNRPPLPGRRRREYNRGTALMAQRIAGMPPFEIVNTVNAAAVVLPASESAVVAPTMNGLVNRQQRFKAGPVRPSLRRVAVDVFQDWKANR